VCVDGKKYKANNEPQRDTEISMLLRVSITVTAFVFINNWEKILELHEKVKLHKFNHSEKIMLFW
jgi:hypothetical protein